MAQELAIVPPCEEPVTLPVHCAHCHGAITLQFGDWPRHKHPPIPQPWVCAYCLQKNAGEFPGRLMWATKRDQDDSRSVV